MRLLKNRPLSFQGPIIKRAYKRGRAGLFLEMGLGKTFIALAIIARLWRRKGVRRVLIICPKSVRSVWVHQLFEHLNIAYTVVQDVPKLINLDMTCDDTLIFLVITYGQSWRSLAQLRNFNAHAIIVDEGHRVKNRKSRQSKAIHSLGDETPYRFLLTGTPIEDDPVDLWSLFRFIDKRCLGEYWTHFEKRFTRKAGFGGYKQKVKKHRLKELYRRTSRLSFVKTKRDELDLPPETDVYLDFELTGEAKKQYRSLEDNFFSEYGEIDILPRHGASRMIMMRQIVRGFLPVDDETLVQLNQDALTTFLDWMVDYPRKKKLVIFAWFTPEIQMLKTVLTKMGRKVTVLDGSTHESRRGDWKVFQSTDRYDTFLAQIATGSEGIELFAADTAVFYSKSPRYIMYSQARARLVRKGQTKPVTFIHLRGKHTIDVDTDHVLERRYSTSQDLFKQLKRRYLSHGKGKEREDRRAEEEEQPAALRVAGLRRNLRR